MMEHDMQAYGNAFANVYNKLWADFANWVAPYLIVFYSDTETGRSKKPVLDLCCGSGQLARHFLDSGFPVIGIDLSAHMLAHAKENNAEYVASGRADFRLGDAASFALDRPAGFAVSTFDALNHLDGLGPLRGCFRSVFNAVEPEAFFVFDLNTRLGLTRWNGTNVIDGEHEVVITRGVFDGASEKAVMKVSGFFERADGSYDRFEETIFNYAFGMQDVEQALLDAGFRSVHFAAVKSLSVPLDDPEKEGRVFVVSRK